jgi:hypothetical protein
MEVNRKVARLLGKNRNPCYTIGSRRIAPRRRQASNEEKTNVAEIDFKPSRTTGDGRGKFFTPIGRNPLKSPDSEK